MSDAAGQKAHAYASLRAPAYESILLTLSQADTNDRSEPVRTISLTAAAPKVVVGRSSKTVSKGLVPAVDNCYFDCPVVSRLHAEIEADLKKGLLRLTDTGSLHGTSLNGRALDKGVASDLKSGDTVSFGIHVARGVDLFYPISCTVDVAIRAYVPPVTKARSYSAPESADELSDASDGDNDCSSIDLEPTSTDEEDNDAISSQASDAGDVTVPLGHMEGSDYGEEESDHEDEDYESGSENGSDRDSDGDSNSDSDVDDDSDGSLEEELHVLHQDDADADKAALEMPLAAAQGGDEGGVRDGARSAISDSENDDSGAFLYKELKQFSKGDAAASQSAGDSVPNHGLWTPLAGSPGNQSPAAAAADADGGDDCMEGPKMAAEEDSAPKFGRQPDSLADAAAPLSATSKCNISSILNPSPPPSSPVNERAAASAEGLAPDSQEQCTVQPPPRATTATAASAAAQALHVPGFTYSADHDLPHGDRVMLQRLVAVMAGAEELEEAKKRHATKDNRSGNQAVTVLHYEKETTSKKRKAEEMLAATAAATAGPSASVPVAAVPAPTPSAPVDDGNPPAKRQASSAAVAARKQLRSRVWAVAETLGIAALGGAVVLGSLIYTAPAF